MDCKQINEEMFKSIVNAKVWNEISKGFGLTDEMLDRYADKLNWKEVSGNWEIHWTVKLVEKWAERLDWEELSNCHNKYLITPDVIAYFVNRWNWRNLSKNSALTLDYTFIDRFIDRWDWSELVNRWHNDNDDIYNMEFYERYRGYIPMDAVTEGSALLDRIVQSETDRMMKDLTKGC